MILADHHPFMGWHEGWWIVFGLLQAFFWIAVIVAIVALVRGRSRRPGPSPALRTLEELYASGQISREEFLERRSVLGGPSRTE